MTAVMSRRRCPEPVVGAVVDCSRSSLVAFGLSELGSYHPRLWRLGTHLDRFPFLVIARIFLIGAIGMYNKIILPVINLFARLAKAISCRSACCIESSCNKGEKDDIIDEASEVAAEIANVVYTRMTSV